MAYMHRVHSTEQATGLLTPVIVDSAIPVYFGTSPKGEPNKPQLIYKLPEATDYFGYVAPNTSGNFDFTLSEAMYAHFQLFATAPIVMINVLDPATHKTSYTDAVVVAEGKGILKFPGVIDSSVVITDAVRGTDYELTTSADGKTNLLLIDGGSLADGTISVVYNYADPSKVTSSDIIGGVNGSGQSTGLELIDKIFPMFRKTIGNIVVPAFSGVPAVAAVMKAKAQSVSGLYKAEALIDVPTDTVTKYQDVAAWKNDNNIVDTHQIAHWPMASIGGTKIHLSVQSACIMMRTDANNGGNPHKSPSNEIAQADSAVLKNGTEVWLEPTQAELLNGEGVVTLLNFIGGWRLWGNETAAYPANTDVKDRFIPVRRMFNWVSNTLVQTMWQKLDQPLNRRQIETIIDSENQWLNSLVATGALLGARVEFIPGENPDIQLLDGKAVFHVYLTPPTPNKEILHVLEYDVSNFSTLFD